MNIEIHYIIKILVLLFLGFVVYIIKRNNKKTYNMNEEKKDSTKKARFNNYSYNIATEERNESTKKARFNNDISDFWLIKCDEHGNKIKYDKYGYICTYDKSGKEIKFNSDNIHSNTNNIYDINNNK